jgi:hypothetical protein
MRKLVGGQYVKVVDIVAASAPARLGTGTIFSGNDAGQVMPTVPAKISKAAQALMNENPGRNWSGLKGTGMFKQITKTDVENFLQQ